MLLWSNSNSNLALWGEPMNRRHAPLHLPTRPQTFFQRPLCCILFHITVSITLGGLLYPHYPWLKGTAVVFCTFFFCFWSVVKNSHSRPPIRSFLIPLSSNQRPMFAPRVNITHSIESPSRNRIYSVGSSRLVTCFWFLVFFFRQVAANFVLPFRTHLRLSHSTSFLIVTPTFIITRNPINYQHTRSHFNSASWPCVVPHPLQQQPTPTISTQTIDSTKLALYKPPVLVPSTHLPSQTTNVNRTQSCHCWLNGHR